MPRRKRGAGLCTLKGGVPGSSTGEACTSEPPGHLGAASPAVAAVERDLEEIMSTPKAHTYVRVPALYTVENQPPLAMWVGMDPAEGGWGITLQDTKQKVMAWFYENEDLGIIGPCDLVDYAQRYFSSISSFLMPDEVRRFLVSN